MHDSQTIEIYAAADAAEAHLVRMHLEEEGIMARVVGGALEVGGFPVGSATPRVWVQAADEIRARTLIAEWDAHHRAHRHDAEDDDDESESEQAGEDSAFETNEP